MLDVIFGVALYIKFMKLTKRQRRYLDAIRRCDWDQSNKDGTLVMRHWARDNKLIVHGSKAGELPIRLTEKAIELLLL